MLERVESHPVELPGVSPSPLRKALAGWELSEQQGETPAPCQTGRTLKQIKTLTVAFGKTNDIRYLMYQIHAKAVAAKINNF